jgi:hypothetical protein
MSEWPFLDHSTSGRGGLGLPLAGYFKTLNLPLTAFAVLTLLAAVWLHRSRPWNPITLGALLFALLIPFLGKDVLRYSGDSFRVMGLAHALLLVGAAGQLAPKARSAI